MTPQERDLITSLFDRLHQVGTQPKDRDAEALIYQGVQSQPDTPYLLVQTVLIQDMALAEAHNRIKELEAQAQAQPQQQPASFLAGGRGSVPQSGGPAGGPQSGPWARVAQPVPQQAPQPQPSPVWTQSAAQAPPPMAPLAAPGASSGFLRQAATTAAGIAGGALLFEGISSLFGPHYGNSMFSGMTPQPGIGETVINNYYDNQQPPDDTRQADANSDPTFTQADDQQDPGNQDLGNDDNSQDFGGGDSGSTDV